jgi:hypothetical protein
MAFNRKGFINAAVAQYAQNEEPIDYDEINSYLESQGVEKITGVEKTLLNEVIPKVVAGVGAGASALAAGAVSGPFASITVPPAAGAGGFAGYGGGKVINEMLKKIAGLDPESAEKYLEKALPEAATAGLITSSVAELPYAIKAITNPFGTTKKVLGGAREKIIGEQTVPSAQSQTDILNNLKTNKYYQMAPVESQKAASARLGQYFEGVNPQQVVNPGPGGVYLGTSTLKSADTMRVNDMYKNLIPFETMGKAYTRSGDSTGTALGQGTNLASHVIRDYLNTQIPWSAQKANQILSTINKIQPATQKIVRTGVTVGAPLYLLRKKLAELLMPSD